MTDKEKDQQIKNLILQNQILTQQLQNLQSLISLQNQNKPQQIQPKQKQPKQNKPQQKQPKQNKLKHQNGYLKPEEVMKILNNPIEEIPIYERLSREFKKGGRKKVKEEFERILNEIKNGKEKDREIFRNIVWFDDCLDKNYFWYIFEKVIKRFAHSFHYNRNDGYEFNVFGKNCYDGDFWRYFNLSLGLLFNLQTAEFRYGKEFFQQRDKQPTLFLEEKYKNFENILKFCLINYRNFFNEQKDKNPSLKPLTVSRSQSYNSKDYTISLMDSNIKGIIQILTFHIPKKM